MAYKSAFFTDVVFLHYILQFFVIARTFIKTDLTSAHFKRLGK